MSYKLKFSNHEQQHAHNQQPMAEKKDPNWYALDCSVLGSE